MLVHTNGQYPMGEHRDTVVRHYCSHKITTWQDLHPFFDTGTLGPSQAPSKVSVLGLLLHFTLCQSLLSNPEHRQVTDWKGLFLKKKTQTNQINSLKWQGKGGRSGWVQALLKSKICGKAFFLPKP